MGFHDGNKKDKKHYWLTPEDLMDDLNKQFNFDFDPCPYPKDDDFDGLTNEWGSSNYVNPPFGTIMHEGKKKGPTAWARKAIKEYEKGKNVVFVYPIDKWVLMLLEHTREVRNLEDVKWCSIEDGLPGPGIGRHVACFILSHEEIKCPDCKDSGMDENTKISIPNKPYPVCPNCKGAKQRNKTDSW